MRDRVADVLAERQALERGPGTALVLSILLHGSLAALAVYGALHATAPQPATFVSIRFAPMPATAPSAPRAEPRKAVDTPQQPRIEEPKPRIEEPKPEPSRSKPPQKPEKNTVPLSPFGRSSKKGSETPASAPPVATPPSQPGVTTTPDAVPVGGVGVTGIEGGDFPHALYIQAMNRKIGAVWVRPSVPPGTVAVVSFRIQRDGRITDERLEIASGIGTFDRAALSAVRSASPLNALPFQYSGTYLGMKLAFK